MASGKTPEQRAAHRAFLEQQAHEAIRQLIEGEWLSRIGVTVRARKFVGVRMDGPYDFTNLTNRYLKKLTKWAQDYLDFTWSGRSLYLYPGKGTGVDYDWLAPGELNRLCRTHRGGVRERERQEARRALDRKAC